MMLNILRDFFTSMWSKDKVYTIKIVRKPGKGCRVLLKKEIGTVLLLTCMHAISCTILEFMPKEICDNHKLLRHKLKEFKEFYEGYRELLDEKGNEKE